MKICLIRNDKMGDMILTLPVVQGLKQANQDSDCLLYTSPSPRDRTRSRMPSSA